MGERAAWEIARRLDAGEHVDAAHRRARHRARAEEPPRVGADIAADASRFVTDGKPVRPAVVRGGPRRQAAFAKMSRAAPVRDERPQRPPAAPAARRRGGVLQPARAAARRERDGRPLRFAVRARARTRSYGGERIPAFETVKHSIVTMRGCFGGCTFCSITEHEGRIIQSRSEASVLREVRALSRMEGFGGTITDVGGPTANMYKMALQGRAHRERVPAPVVRAPGHLREPRHRSRAARQSC